MNKQELIKKIAGSRWNDWAVEDIMNQIEAEGWLRNPGEPIEHGELRDGDRLRVVHRPGYEVIGEFYSDRDKPTPGTKYFLLDRPKPELPTEPGSVVADRLGTTFTLDKNGCWRNGDRTYDPSNFVSIDWEVVA